MVGKFISFEGGDGVGKTTQVHETCRWLHEVMGFKVLQLREPGGTPLGEKVRHIVKHDPDTKGMCPVAELLLLNASRAQLVHEVIKPALAEGTYVVCDRFYDSTIAYQGFGRDMGAEFVFQAITMAVGSTRPTVTFMLKASRDVTRVRLTAREPALFDRFEAEDQAFFNRVEAGYNYMSGLEPDRIKVIDANRSAQEVSADIQRRLEEIINPATS